MMSESENFRLHAYVKGHVQGVGFRYHVLKAAQDDHLTGWVRNLYDGRVEVMAEGPHADLNQLLLRLRLGPISAQVNNVDYTFSEVKGDFHGFRVRGTA